MKTPTLAAAPPRPPKVWTDEAFLAVAEHSTRRYEVIDGKLTWMNAARMNHGDVAHLIGVALTNYVRPRRLGKVFDASATFRLNPDNVLVPDVSFSTVANLRRYPAGLDGFGVGAPDLAVEVISPSERKTKVRLKMEKYFAHGARLVWHVYLRGRRVEVFTAPDAVAAKRLDAGDALDGGEVIPGFCLPLRGIFDQDWFATD